MEKVLKYFGIPKINKPIHISHKNILGKGMIGKVYKSYYGDIPVSVKIVSKPNKFNIIFDIFNTTPTGLYTTPKIVLDISFTEVLISYILSKYNHPTVQKFYGYKITDNSVIMVKEWCEYDFPTFIKNHGSNTLIISNLLIHIILSIKLHFQEYTNGYYFDAKPDNILVKPYNKPYVVYKFGDKEYRIKANGYIPVLTDFGAGFLTKIGDKNIIVSRFFGKNKYEQVDYGFWHTYDNIKNIYKSNDEIIFDKGFDLYYFFYINGSKYIADNWIVKYYNELLKTMNITSYDNYKPNVITIDYFINSKSINDFIKQLN